MLMDLALGLLPMAKNSSYHLAPFMKAHESLNGVVLIDHANKLQFHVIP